MIRQLLNHFAVLSGRQIQIYTLIAAMVMEAVTLIFRFGLNMQFTRDTHWLRHFTFNLRIHHGMTGLVVLLLTLVLVKNPAWRNLLLVISLAMILSDFVHHFLILWPMTGSPQFDLTYPHK